MFNNNEVLYNVWGHVAEILTPNRVLIAFQLDDEEQIAFLTNQKFFHNGKHIPPTSTLADHLKINNKVKFSCRVNDNLNYNQHHWYVTACWRNDESDTSKAAYLTGITNVVGTVINLKQRHGTLVITNAFGEEERIYFLASKVYLYGKRVTATKLLSTQLSTDDRVFVDAMPCFPEENSYNCTWFATCVHKGKKPELPQYFRKDNQLISLNDTNRVKVDPFKVETDDKQTIKQSVKHTTEYSTDILSAYAGHPAHTHASVVANESLPIITSEHDTFLSEIGKIELDLPTSDTLLRDIKLITNNPRAVFVKSEGIILDIINDEYGVILGQFKLNVYQSVLFHRSHAFLFKANLAHSKLSEVFLEGDRVRFIAIEATAKFVTGWIATQVSVARQTEYAKKSSKTYDVEDYISSSALGDLECEYPG